MGMLAIKQPPRLRLKVDEDLFPIEGRITCRACDTEVVVPLGNPALLCTNCLSDLSATAYRVADEYADAMAAFFEAGRALTRAARNNEWYAKTEEARGDMTVSPELFARAWEAARQGPHASIVAMRDWVDECAVLMQRAERRYLAAQPELAAARAERGEPVDVI